MDGSQGGECEQLVATVLASMPVYYESPNMVKTHLNILLSADALNKSLQKWALQLHACMTSSHLVMELPIQGLWLTISLPSDLYTPFTTLSNIMTPRNPLSMSMRSSLLVFQAL